MRAFGRRGEESWTSFGQRRGISDPVRFSLDLTRTRADCIGAAGPGSYPSPPMSGSPPLPPKLSHEVAERSQGPYPARTQSDERTQRGAAGGTHPFSSDTSERGLYPFSRLEGSTTQPQRPYPEQPGYITAQPATYLSGPGTGPGSSHPGPLPALQTYAAATHHPIPDSLHSTPPKPQRKTKGHVASACVPCKKAHLRCISTNKEGACVDVQHKKRGRPRLRDDSQTKYEAARYGSGADAMRRPLWSAYGPGPALGMVYDDPLRRTQSYRVLKSQPAESVTPRFPERGLESDANIYPPLLSISTARAPEEPIAFLTISLEFSRASAPFLGAIGRTSVRGFNLADVVVPEERARASRLQQQAQEEQTRQEPAYLPPILNERSEGVMQSLSFTSEEVSRYPLQWSETFSFLGDDGQARRISSRAGLATRDSIYFVVLLLDRSPRPSYPTPSPGLRDMGGSLEPGLQPYSQPTPLSATFDPRQWRLSDPGYDPRQSGPHGAPAHMFSAPSPGFPSAYSSSPSRPDYPTTPRTYQAPRSEMYPAGRPYQAAEYQHPPLPRIRSPPAATAQQFEPSQRQPRRPPPFPYEAREERSRIGIGGLLEQPASTKSP
ncbi:hypothetical protein C8A03DRAFT_46378 [Achaetomium macrosporum]|uniref:Zn(2)-C6 fungal-type domain-containing protein n=1 Tax=Achaetomium macrosporum TaxID=79813 RepID=A0AAN7C5U9_9PEZI|nr:hypothetical protein C8A03DRAFT_46378 [Achaetomium macrosporum]